MDAPKFGGEVTAAILGILALFAPVLTAQSTGALEGTAINSVTHVGIAGADVQVTAEEGDKSASATTDSSGRFRIASLPPGAYTAEFRHQHFCDPQSDGSSQVKFQIGVSSEPTRIRAEMTPRSTLRGRVLDNAGHPMQGIEVELDRIRYPGSYSAETDKDGRFSFEEVRPTAYRLAAQASGTRLTEGTPPSRRGERIVWARTYYPEAESAIQAAPVLIPPGAEMDGYDIRMGTSPAYRIRGRVVDEAAKPVAGLQVKLMSEDPAGSEQTSVTDKEGGFEFIDVRPGRWRCVATPGLNLVIVDPKKSASRDGGSDEGPAQPVTADSIVVHLTGSDDKTMQSLGLLQTTVGNLEAARARGATGSAGSADSAPAEYLRRVTMAIRRNEKPRQGSALVDVKDQDADRVEVPVAAPFTIDFSAEREEFPGAERKPSTAIVRLKAVDGFNRSVDASQNHGGQWAFDGLFPGRYKVAMGAGEAGYYLASVRLGDREILGQEVDLAPGAPPIRALFQSRPGRVTGTVDGGNHATVVLLPCRENLRDLDEIAKAQIRSDGHFEIGSLRPDEYYAWAFERLDIEALRDPEFARTLVSRATTVTIERGGTATLKLSVTPWPE